MKIKEKDVAKYISANKYLINSGCVRIPNRTKNTETTTESAEIPKRPLNQPENTKSAQKYETL